MNQFLYDKYRTHFSIGVLNCIDLNLENDTIMSLGPVGMVSPAVGIALITEDYAPAPVLEGTNSTLSESNLYVCHKRASSAN
jgi:hypothetical protein